MSETTKLWIEVLTLKGQLLYTTNKLKEICDHILPSGEEAWQLRKDTYTKTCLMCDACHYTDEED